MSVPAQLAKNITLHNGRKYSEAKKSISYEYIRKDCDPDSLHTFIRVPSPHFVLHARNLRNRLVISLPDNYHDLRTTRFFLITQSKKANVTITTPSENTLITNPGDTKFIHYSHKPVTTTTHLINTTIGSLVFRQDQLHIDLFVFFSVFFSCFFLFLSLCVIVWKFKSMSDLRTARRRHAVEMQYMAQRPFASQFIILEQNKSTPITTISTRSTATGSNKTKKNKHEMRMVRQHQDHHSQPRLFEPYQRSNQR